MSPFPFRCISPRWKARLPLREGYARLAEAVTYQSARLDSTGRREGESLRSTSGGGRATTGAALLRWRRNLLDEEVLLSLPSEVGFVPVPQSGRTLLIEVGAVY
ncbi:MAG: hypothetical protein ACOX6T_01705 [Myxococcales bacterium]